MGHAFLPRERRRRREVDERRRRLGHLAHGRRQNQPGDLSPVHARGRRRRRAVHERLLHATLRDAVGEQSRPVRKTKEEQEELGGVVQVSRHVLVARLHKIIINNTICFKNDSQLIFF